MPISGDKFEKYKNSLVCITEFLEENKGVGFTVEEIAEGLGIEKEVIQPTLSFLPLIELLAMSKGRKLEIESVTIKNVIYYRYNEKYHK